MIGEREVTIKLMTGEFAIIISEVLASSYRVWSDPMQVMVEPGRDGSHDVLEMTMRRYECPLDH